MNKDQENKPRAFTKEESSIFQAGYEAGAFSLLKDNQALIELVNDFLELNNCTGECYRYHRLNKKCEHQELSEKAEKWKGR